MLRVLLLLPAKNAVEGGMHIFISYVNCKTCITDLCHFVNIAKLLETIKVPEKKVALKQELLVCEVLYLLEYEHRV